MYPNPRISFASRSCTYCKNTVIVMLVGYSMDYVLYIAKAYEASPRPLRAQRSRDALTHLGVSVWAGGVANVLASVFLVKSVFLPNSLHLQYDTNEKKKEIRKERGGDALPRRALAPGGVANVFASVFLVTLSK
jgi:hypothetical protein